MLAAYINTSNEKNVWKWRKDYVCNILPQLWLEIQSYKVRFKPWAHWHKTNSLQKDWKPSMYSDILQEETILSSDLKGLLRSYESLKCVKPHHSNYKWVYVIKNTERFMISTRIPYIQVYSSAPTSYLSPTWFSWHGPWQYSVKLSSVWFTRATFLSLM